MLPIAAIAMSALFIAMLCIGDPKRRRTLRASGSAHRPATRRALAAGVALPGMGFALMGDAAAFLLWIGGAAITGWLLVQWRA